MNKLIEIQKQILETNGALAELEREIVKELKSESLAAMAKSLEKLQVWKSQGGGYPALYWRSPGSTSHRMRRASRCRESSGRRDISTSYVGRPFSAIGR